MYVACGRSANLVNLRFCAPRCNVAICGLNLGSFVAEAFKSMLTCGAAPYLFLLEASMAWSLALVGGCVVLLALIVVYVPTIYIRKTNKVIGLLEKIEANTRK